MSLCRTSPLPHEQVYARLAPSTIHGVGVFAIRAIPSGANIFPNDRLGVHWFDAAEIDGVVSDPAIRRYYDDFCIRKDGKYGCPLNFNSMTIGWHLNEPPAGGEANVVVDEHYWFLAKRDIAPGEELTLWYAAFSDLGDRS